MRSRFVCSRMACSPGDIASRSVAGGWSASVTGDIPVDSSDVGDGTSLLGAPREDERVVWSLTLGWGTSWHSSRLATFPLVRVIKVRKAAPRWMLNRAHGGRDIAGEAGPEGV